MKKMYVKIGVVLILLFCYMFINKSNILDKTEKNQVSTEIHYNNNSNTAHKSLTNDKDEYMYDESIFKNKKQKNILLIGQDRRQSESKDINTRSDSLILISINENSDEIKMVSFMRDMYVEIPGYNKNRINAAYAIGGISLLKDTLKENFNLSIDNYVEVDFEGFLNSVEELTPYDIYLSEEEATYMNERSLSGSKLDKPLDWGLKAGINSLNKDQLLKYVRMRYVGNSDYERTERQRKVLKITLKKLKDVSIVDAISIIKNASKHVTTDLSTSEIINYALFVLTKDIKINNTLRIPVDSGYSAQTISGAQVLIPDLSINKKELFSYLYSKNVDDKTYK